MRCLLALALVIVACGDRAERRASPGSSAFSTSRGPDAIVLRIPRAGGAVRAYIYPRLDSPVFTGPRAPAIERILGFDSEAGLVAFLGENGRPGRIDLRLARVTAAGTAANLSSITSANGSDIYAVTGPGRIVRFAPSGNWVFDPPYPPNSVLPQSDGSLLVTARSGRQTTLWRMRAPDPRLLDTTYLPLTHTTPPMQAGDRVYFMTDTALVGINAKDFSPLRAIRFRDSVVALAATPSADRIYAAARGDDELRVIDRYSQRVKATVPLPGAVSELRMDPLGRYLLARAERGDSAWVVALGTNRVVGALVTQWTNDLPTVAFDGAIAILRRPDVVFVEPESLQPVRSVPDGARDFWFFTNWNGFRARAEGIDRPVTFAAPDSPGAVLPQPDTAPPPPPSPAAESTAVTSAPTAAPYTVSFAALLSEAAANAEAQRITIRGSRPRVVATQRAGATVYRVIAGPYATREEAEQAGRESGHAFWIYQGEP